MRTLVLDTSAAIAWYLPESFQEHARTWQTQLLEGNLHCVVPSLHFWEFSNALRTYVRRNDLSPELANEIFSTHLSAPLVTEEPARARVLEIALSYDATSYDAVYIALSLELHVPLLSAERPTRPWAKKLGRNFLSLTSTG